MHGVGKVLPVRSLVHCRSAARGRATLDAIISLSPLAAWVLVWTRVIYAVLDVVAVCILLLLLHVLVLLNR